MDSKILTIMLTDMKGFTETSSQRSRNEILDLIKTHDELLRPVVEHFGGRVIKTMGDAFLVAYESPTDAVLAGLVMQHTLGEYNESAEHEQKIEIRVAINVGEVELTDDDIFGEPVNLAARINAVTEAGEIYFTEAVYLAMNRKEVPSSEIGVRTFKGIPEPVKLFHVVQDPVSDQYRKALVQFGEAGPKPPEEEKKQIGRRPKSGGRKKLGSLLTLVGAALLIAAGFYFIGPMLKGDDWPGHVRALAAADGYSRAWMVIDTKFQENPTDSKVKQIAEEILKQENEALIDRDGHEVAVKRLDEHRAQRDYLTAVDKLKINTQRRWAAALLATKKREEYNKGLNLLWEIYKLDEKDMDTFLDYAHASANARNGEYYFIRNAHKIVTHKPALAKDPRVHDRVLKIMRDRQTLSSDDYPKMYQIIRTHYLDEVKDELRPILTDASDHKGRLTAYGVLKGTEKIPEGRLFEYQRLNLFFAQRSGGESFKEAVAFFEAMVDEKKDPRPFTEGKVYDAIPVLERYGSTNARTAVPLIEKLLYPPCREYLIKATLMPEKTSLRYYAFQIVKNQGDATAELTHKYHMLHLSEMDYHDLNSFQYAFFTDAFKYYSQTPPADPKQRADASKVVKEKLQMIEKAKANKYIRKREEQVKWLEENLGKCLKQLEAKP